MVGGSGPVLFIIAVLKQLTFGSGGFLVFVREGRARPGPDPCGVDWLGVKDGAVLSFVCMDMVGGSGPLWFYELSIKNMLGQYAHFEHLSIIFFLYYKEVSFRFNRVLRETILTWEVV
jgi:hypothetical protein